MKHIKLFESWKDSLNEWVLNPDNNHVEESMKLELNDHLEDATKKFLRTHGKSNNEKGILWSVLFSTADDERHYQVEDDEDEDDESESEYSPDTDYNLEKDGYKIVATSAVEALIKMVMMDWDDTNYPKDSIELWGGMPIWDDGCEWTKGSDDDDQADWFFDDGCQDSDQFHWKQFSIKKLDDNNLAKLATIMKPEEIASLKAYKEKFGEGYLTGKDYGI